MRQCIYGLLGSKVQRRGTLRDDESRVSTPLFSLQL